MRKIVSKWIRRVLGALIIVVATVVAMSWYDKVLSVVPGELWQQTVGLLVIIALWVLLDPVIRKRVVGMWRVGVLGHPVGGKATGRLDYVRIDKEENRKTG